MAVSETVDININSTQALASLKSIERNVDLLTNGFKDFMTGVAEGMTSALRETNKATAGLDRMAKSVKDVNDNVNKTNIGRKMGAEVAQANKSLTEFNSRMVSTGRQLIGLESIVGAFAFTNLIRGALDYAKTSADTNLAALSAVKAQEALTEASNKFYSALLKAIKPITEFAAKTDMSQESMDKLVETLIYGGSVFQYLIKLLPYLGDALSWLGKQQDKLKESFKGSIDAAKEFFNIKPEPIGRYGEMSLEAAKKYEQTFQDIANARFALQLKIEDQTAAQKRSNDAVLKALQLENRMFGANQDAIEIEKLRLRFQLERTDKFAEFERRMRDLSPLEAQGGGRALLEAERAEYLKLSKAAESAQIAEVKRLQKLTFEREQMNRQMERTIELFNQQAERSSAVTEARGAIAGRRGDIAFERSLIGMGGFERELRTRRREIDQFRNDLIRSTTEAFTIGGEIVDPEGFNRAIQEIYRSIDGFTTNVNGVVVTTKGLRQELDELAASGRRFDAGWSEAFENYVDNAKNSAEQAKSYFEIFSRGFENVFAGMRRGFPGIKEAFKNLIDDMIAQFLRLTAQRAFLSLFGGDTAGGAFLRNVFSLAVGGPSLAPVSNAVPIPIPGRAFGGPVGANRAYMVGERGPELFVPGMSGGIVPGQFGTNVTYNIQAVDAESFRSLVARDPAFIYAVTERGRQGQPTRRMG